MKRTASALGTLTLLALAGPAVANAQELPHGTWTGTLAPPGGEPIPVTYEVGAAEGALSVVMRSAMIAGEMPFRDVRLDGSELTFWWEPGIRVDCALTRNAQGGFDGTCSDGIPEAGAGVITMVPPV